MLTPPANWLGLNEHAGLCLPVTALQLLLPLLLLRPHSGSSRDSPTEAATAPPARVPAATGCSCPPARPPAAAASLLAEASAAADQPGCELAAPRLQSPRLVYCGCHKQAVQYRQDTSASMRSSLQHRFTEHHWPCPMRCRTASQMQCMVSTKRPKGCWPHCVPRMLKKTYAGTIGNAEPPTPPPLAHTRTRTLTAFFLLATVFGLPLRVRALVFVRWPRTGRPCKQQPCNEGMMAGGDSWSLPMYDTSHTAAQTTGRATPRRRACWQAPRHMCSSSP